MIVEVLIGLGVLTILFVVMVLIAPWLTIGSIAYFKWADNVVAKWKARKDESISK